MISSVCELAGSAEIVLATWQMRAPDVARPSGSNGFNLMVLGDLSERDIEIG